MGERIPRDFYPTPLAAVPPLVRTYGVRKSLSRAVVTTRWCAICGLRCVHASDIATGQDDLAFDSYGVVDAIITNRRTRAR